MDTKVNIDFGPDKSQMLRGLAIIFMIMLHNGVGGLFKICVPIFTFLVGYGYAFAKTKDMHHALKRSWHLLSHFWLILLGIFVPVAIWNGGWKPNMYELLTNMFGLESTLNWYSWYIYFYLWAMLIMIPISRFIARFKITACLALTVICFGTVGAIHMISNWSDNVWLQAVHDCFLCSPVMFTGFYLAEGGGITKLKIKRNFSYAALATIIMVASFTARSLPMASYLDFILVPIFCAAAVALFNIIHNRLSSKAFIALGRESMNMWFIHALLFTSFTATVFAPLLLWINSITLRVIIMVLVSYCLAKITTRIYHAINE